MKYLSKPSVLFLLITLLVTPILFVGQTKEADQTKSRFEKLELFSKIMFLIESQYYREVDPERLIQGAIRGMMQTLDPHSAFLDEDVFSKIQEDTRGEFGGLGIEVTQRDGVLVVITPIDDTPAFKAGIKAGDRIIEIDHESMVGATLEEAVEKMRGKAGSTIKLGIVREGVEGIRQFEFKREIIKVEPVKAELVDGKFLVLRLTQFQRRSTEAIVSNIKKYRKQTEKTGGLQGLILDLRSNPGGLLEEAVTISSLFMKEGIVVSTEGRNPEVREVRNVMPMKDKELEIPIVVLINGSSASASEIVAGALQDSRRALIMGTKSFGKGSVQTVAKVDEKQGVKLTIAQYLTPKGRRIQAVGIVPDIEIPEAEGKWIAENLQERNSVRESDLKNHLTATIETEEEKIKRIEMEKQDRIERVKRVEAIREKKKQDANESEERPTRYTAEEDYQVRQAVRFLKSYDLIRELATP